MVDFIHENKKMIKRIIRFFRSRKISSFDKGLIIENSGTIQIAKNSTFGGIVNRSVKLSFSGTHSGYIYNVGSIVVGQNTRIHKGFKIYNEGKIIIGDNTYINPNCLIICKSVVSVGSNCAISWNVTIMDDDLHRVNGTKVSKPVSIGSNVLIGHGVTILKGVTIYNGAVIGAGSVVTKDVHECTMVAGNPAVKLKENIRWE